MHSRTEVAGHDRNAPLLPGNTHGEVDTDDENVAVDLLVEHPVDIVVHSNNRIPREEEEEAVVIQLFHVHASSIHLPKQKLLPHHARIEHAYPVPNSSSSRQPYSIYSWDLDRHRCCYYHSLPAVAVDASHQLPKCVLQEQGY